MLGVFGRATRNQHLLSSGEAFAEWLRELCVAIGMTPVGDPVIEQYDHWAVRAPSAVIFLDDGTQPQGPGATVVQTLEQSAITGHTYTEDSMLSVLVDSCDDIPNVVQLGEAMQWKWGLKALRLIYDPTWGWNRLKGATPLPDSWPQWLNYVGSGRLVGGSTYGAGALGSGMVVGS